MGKVPSPTIEELIEAYNERLKRRLVKHVLKNVKKLQSERRKLPRKKGGKNS